LQKDVQVTVVGKVFRANRLKVLALNRALGEYFKLIKWYLGFNSKSKVFCMKTAMKKLRGSST